MWHFEMIISLCYWTVQGLRQDVKHLNLQLQVDDLPAKSSKVTESREGNVLSEDNENFDEKIEKWLEVRQAIMRIH